MTSCKLLKEKKWRRGQDSNLHILADGGFQDRCTTIMRPLRTSATAIITYAFVRLKLSLPVFRRRSVLIRAVPSMFFVSLCGEFIPNWFTAETQRTQS
jgi:hypothetical protein